MSEKIVIDLEWDPNGSLEFPSVLQLGAIKYNCDTHEVVDCFFSFIKPLTEISNMDQLLKFMPVTEKELMAGRESSNILNEFANWCGDCSFIIWGSFNRQALAAFTKEYIKIDEANTMDLQQVYMAITNKNVMNLEKACLEVGSKITYPLHNSLNDAQTFFELCTTLEKEYNLEEVMMKYSKDKEEERARQQSICTKETRFKSKLNLLTYRFFIDKHSGEIHRQDCPLLLEDAIAEPKGFGTFRGALKQGSSLCPNCFHTNVNFSSELRVNEKIHLIELHNLCFDLKLHSTNLGRTMFITTAAGSWFLETGTSCPVLYHRNNKYLSKHQKGLSGYHKQIGHYSSDQEAIMYIQRHDKQVLSGHYGLNRSLFKDP